VQFEFGDGVFGGWYEEGTVTALRSPGLFEITLDETIELPDWLGGGWCRVVEREPSEVYVVEAQRG
jgi:hypothetical protein